MITPAWSYGTGLPYRMILSRGPWDVHYMLIRMPRSHIIRFGPVIKYRTNSQIGRNNQISIPTESRTKTYLLKNTIKTLFNIRGIRRFLRTELCTIENRLLQTFQFVALAMRWLRFPPPRITISCHFIRHSVCMYYCDPEQIHGLIRFSIWSPSRHIRQISIFKVLARKLII
jgi:hypothetical protein